MAPTPATERRAPLGFVWRVEMVRDLSAPPRLALPMLPPGYAFGPFDPRALDRLAEVEYLAFRDTPDALAYAKHLGSPLAARRAWDELVGEPRFDAARSLVLTYEGLLVGFVQASRGARAWGYVTSLAVLPEHRGGTGRALLLESLARFRAAGARAVGLTVTSTNHRALRLYEGLGFVEVGWAIRTFTQPR